MSIESVNLSTCEYSKTLDTNKIKCVNDVDDTALFSFNSSYTSNPLETNTSSLTSNSASNTNSSNLLRAELEKTKEEQGLIGKTWDGIKNIFGMNSGSSNVENAIQKLENGEITKEEVEEILENYQDGQEMCVDVAGDMISGIVAVGSVTAAPFTGGTSILLAAGVGAGVKVGIKGLDCAVGGREYRLKDLGYDLITGSMNGAMAPLTNALGGAAGTGVAKACGLNVAKSVVNEAGEEVLEQGIKQAGKGFFTSLLANQGTEYIAKEGAKTGLKTTMAKVAAYGVDMAVDGALSGGTDGFARSLAEGDFENMGQNMADGFLSGLIAAPIIGGGFRLASNIGSKAATRVIKDSDKQLTLALDNFANHNRIGKRIGILSENGITNACLDVGDVLSETAKAQDGKLVAQDISDAVKKVFPNLKNITISDDYEVYKTLMQEVGYPEEQIVDVAQKTLAAAIPNSKTNQSLIRLGSINSFDTDEIINLSTHELEHALNQTYSLSSKAAFVQSKMIPKYVDKIMSKAPMLNQKLFELQNGLLRLAGFDNLRGIFSDTLADRDGLVKAIKKGSFDDLQEKIRNIIRGTVVLPDNNDDNMLLLKAAKILLQDEARAYKVGGLNLGKHLNLESGCSNSEMYSKLYEETIRILDDEIKLQRNNQIRKLLGKPQIDYHVEGSEYSLLGSLGNKILESVDESATFSQDDLFKLMSE